MPVGYDSPEARGNKTIQDIARDADVPIVTVRGHLKRGMIQAEKIGRFWHIPQEEYERVVNSYRTRGFVLPAENEGWRFAEEMAEEIGKPRDSVWRHLREGYLVGTKVRLKGRDGKWVIEPASYGAFVTRYKEAHQRLADWSTVSDYCDTIGLSPQWVRELIRDGRIEADKITRVEAMLVTKDHHTYRLPPHEMERARRVSQLIDIGDVLSSVEIDGVSFSRTYFLYKVFPELGIGEHDHPTRKARLRLEDIPKLLDYLDTNNRTVQLQRDAEERDRFNAEVKEMNLDAIVLQSPQPNLRDDSTLEDEKQLWLLVKQGNNQAFGHLTQTYLHHVYGEARRWGYELEVDSKVARGIFGLWMAIINARSLDGNIRGYAKKYIRGHIINFVKEERGRRGTVSLEVPSGDERTLGQRLGVVDK